MIEANPSFAGKSAAFILRSSASGVYSLGADDYRAGCLIELGFTVPPEGAENEISFEKLDVLTVDVLLEIAVPRLAAATDGDPATFRSRTAPEHPRVYAAPPSPRLGS